MQYFVDSFAAIKKDPGSFQKSRHFWTYEEDVRGSASKVHEITTLDESSFWDQFHVVSLAVQNFHAECALSSELRGDVVDAMGSHARTLATYIIFSPSSTLPAYWKALESQVR